MNVQKYIALLKVAELGSISLVAEQMGYTQPAVSRMITDLEKAWQIDLLRRNRYGVEPSSECLQLMPLLRAIEADCKALDFTISEFHGAQAGLVRVGIFTSVADMWIPRLLKSFQKKYPKIEFDLVNTNTYAEIETCIRQGKVDCGFVSLPTASDLDAYFLMRDELVAVLPTNHPLAKASEFPIRDLEGAPFIMLRERADYEVSHFLEHIPYTPVVKYEVGNEHTILSMVECGLGISITHSLIADNPRYKVVHKRFDFGQHRDIAIAISKNARVSRAAQLFVDHVRTQFAKKKK